jgi:hypothetical protein
VCVCVCVCGFDCVRVCVCVCVCVCVLHRTAHAVDSSNPQSEQTARAPYATLPHVLPGVLRGAITSSGPDGR